MGTELTKNMQDAIPILADPDNASKTWVEKAKLIGVSTTALYLWRQEPEFLDALTKECDKQLKMYRPQIDKGLIEAASTGSTADRKLYYQLTGTLQEADKPKSPTNAIQINIQGYGESRQESGNKVQI